MTSNQRLHARQADGLATVEWLAIADANRFAPIGRLVAKLIEKSGWLGRPAVDELALIAANGRQLFVPIGADVEHKGWLRGVLQMHAVVIEDPVRMPRLARHVGLRQLGPEPGRLDKLRRGHVIRMSIDPVGREEPLGPR